METCKSLYKEQIHCELGANAHSTDEDGKLIHVHANLVWTDSSTANYVQYGAWHVYKGGDPVDLKDEWIFADAIYKSVPTNAPALLAERLADMQEYVDQCNEMQEKYPVGNHGRYQAETILKRRSVTYGDWA